MNSTLLIIDPQNDFCDIDGAALPVPGANADMLRLAGFIRAASRRFAEIIVTLDSHPTVAIERTTFWRRQDGEAVAPYTEITEAQVRAGQYAPRDAAFMPEVLAYLRALESGGRHRLIVWPVHCVVGTWGHNIHPAVAAEIAVWETRVVRGACKVLKGMHPLTEQYSAVSAEVPRDDDPATQPNQQLIARLQAARGPLLVAGEASSHCVAATVQQLLDLMPPAWGASVVLLDDCMSAVPGFATDRDRFFTNARSHGARIMTSTEARELA